MTAESLLEIRLAGGDIAPQNIRAGEMAEILEAIEDMLASLVEKDNAVLTKDDLVIGLVNIKEGSVHLQFSSKYPEAVLPAFHEVSKSVNDNDFNALPHNAVKSLKNFSAFIRRKQCNAEFIARNGTPKERVLAVLSPDIKITSLEPLHGETVIYGKVIRVGGRDPKTMVETLDGLTVYCDIPTEKLAKEVGEFLYSWVKLKGTAKWDAKTLELEEFKIQEVDEYRRGNISQAFSELSLITKEYYSNISDVEKYVAKLRDNRLEE